ncbi:helix-turn-helix domain-containing protein [Paenibacillus sp. Dod16]|uniref:helix-turn-helix domain-containing protein n=1 Tax=Paenibacillus sp. Dod16 TaxID=3416392 RepID=UPI003CEB95E9
MSHNVNNDVGKMIRKYRRARNYTQEELGEILQIDQSYLGRIERGEINITLDTLTKIAKALGINPALLLETKQNVSDQSRAKILEKIDSQLLTLNTSELMIVHNMLREVLQLKKI